MGTAVRTEVRGTRSQRATAEDRGPGSPSWGDHPCRQSLPEASSSQAWSGGRATCWPPSAGPARSGGATCWPLWGARAGWPADPGAASQADAALMSGRELHFLLFKTKIGGGQGRAGLTPPWAGLGDNWTGPPPGCTVSASHQRLWSRCPEVGDRL